MDDTIKVKLHEIETKHNIRIVYACEAGSRAYGIQTEFSDYDIRFIYVRKPAAYLSVRNLEPKHDIIDYSVDGVWDVAGWDIRKALQLLRSSNPGLLEWLGSPVVYRGFSGDGFDDGECVEELRRIAREHMSRRACMYHYYGWFKSTYDKQNAAHCLKSFFYLLRPILAMRFLEKNDGLVPTLFSDLVDRAFSQNDQVETALYSACMRLADDRRTGSDATGHEHMKRLLKFVDSEAKRFKGLKFESGTKEIVSYQALDEVFRSTLTNTWEVD